MKLLFINQSRARSPEKWMRNWVQALARSLVAEGFTLARGVELVVVFVDSSEMKRLNNQYREKNYATDVLSFESMDESSLGELVICPPVIRSNAKGSGLSERGELGFMVIHGVLHLLGMDHENKRDKAEMFALQDRLYAALERRVGLR